MRVLLVEDSDDDAELIGRHLSRCEGGAQIERVMSLAALEAALAKGGWDVVISDFNLPGFTGLRALETVRQRSHDLPFILVSAAVGEDVAVGAMRAGANDYVMKNRLARLLPAVERELREAGARRAQHERLERLAHYDGVTELANRTLFAERLGRQIESDGGTSPVAIGIFDLYGFAAVNAGFGRQKGDLLLRQVAARLVDAMGEERLAHLGGGEFAAMLPHASGESAAARLSELVAQAFAAPFELDANPVHVSTRSGIALHPADGTNAAELLRNAAAAVARAKATGTPHVFYAEGMTGRVTERLLLESQLRRAIERGEFELHYQAKVTARERRLVGAEALIRWRHPELGLVAPMRFIPVLEETGLIVEVGDWTRHEAAAQAQRWVAGRLGPVRIAVNVSVREVQQPDFVQRVAAVLERHAEPLIDLEIVESLAMTDTEACIAKLEAVRRLGIRIAVDDFGTGYSSLANLARLPVQTLKIDRAFTSRLLTEKHARTLVTTIVSMARSLSLDSVAEGVETEAQAQALLGLGCDQLQGYLIGKPVPAHEFEATFGAPGVAA